MDLKIQIENGSNMGTLHPYFNSVEELKACSQISALFQWIRVFSVTIPNFLFTCQPWRASERPLAAIAAEPQASHFRHCVCVPDSLSILQKIRS